MASVYDTVYGWNSATNYSKYNIVSGSNSKYYYSIKNKDRWILAKPGSKPEQAIKKTVIFIILFNNKYLFSAGILV